MQATGAAVWAAGSTSGLKSLELPDIVREVTIAVDNDAAGEKAAREAATRWYAANVSVLVARPDPCADFNELLVRA